MSSGVCAKLFSGEVVPELSIPAIEKTLLGHLGGSVC